MDTSVLEELLWREGWRSRRRGIGEDDDGRHGSRDKITLRSQDSDNSN